MTGTPSRPAPGTRMLFRWRKWDGSAHWVHECVYLGTDEWGDWFGQRAGWRSSRPGRELVLAAPSVSLLPRESDDYVLTVNAPPQRTRIYIDIAWQAMWTDAGEPVAIDMDLDVVRVIGRRGVYVDDRDEWEEHRERFGYPPEVVTRLERRTAELEQRVRDRIAPFDIATADGWLGVLADLAVAEPR